MKHDGRHRAHMVDDSCLTSMPLGSVYSGVVSLWGLRLALFFTKLKKKYTYTTNVKNAYLKAYTKEKNCFITGREFEPLTGHLLIIEKSLYNLKIPDLRWYDKFLDCLCDIGFKQFRTEPNIWTRSNSKNIMNIFLSM